MKNKFLNLILSAIILTLTMTVASYALTIVYAPDGRKVSVPESSYGLYKNSGWYDYPVCYVIAQDGTPVVIAKTMLKSYQNMGYYEGAQIYAPDGRTAVINKNDLYSYIAVGWYTEPVCYITAGTRNAVIYQSELYNYTALGWSEACMIYAPDGRTAIIAKSELAAYKAVGWFDSPYTQQKTPATPAVESTYTDYTIVSNINILNTNKTYIYNFGSVSSVQQFSYMDEGLAFAYENNDTICIITPSKTLQIYRMYALLGDVIADNDGNFYIVWGETNPDNNTDKLTVFISKYDSNGNHLKTTGFIGESIMGDTGNTKIPFYAGLCSSTIANGKLMVNYARKMYSGHQSNNVIGVNIKDMSPVKFSSKWDIPYTSHSFNQRVIWSKIANNFVYADHGDAYDRGFILTVGKKEYRTFSFYLPSNASYDMYVVNKTYAQLGGLLETDKGIVLVGASAKSVGVNTPSEKQNLFVQIFKPKSNTLSPSSFVGGETRTGFTSFDINDRKNSPLEPVTDYGVHWLTNYTDREVIGPHAVVADNKIVILWTEKNTSNNSCEAVYTVLASDGSVIKPATSLGKNIKLNSNEDPIYHNGKVMWTYAFRNEIHSVILAV